MAKPTTVEWPSEPRTLLKHQIYRRYVGCWMGKILQRFPSATIVDAFAGPGRYRDGPDGSSIVIAKAFLEHVGRDRFRPLHLVCNEEDERRRAVLDRRIRELPQHPNLRPVVLPAADFAAAQPAIARRSQVGGRPALPTLWVLDPFDVKSLPFELVARCLDRPKDEALITWFTDEIYRFCEVPAMQAALEPHYGDGSWRTALEASGEHLRKQALMRAYCNRLESLPGVRASPFAISSKNRTARYSIILATHSDKGLECWNPVRWGLDPATGQAVSEKRGPEQPLFDDRSRLRRAPQERAGSTATFAQLRTEAVRLDFMESHLRRTLDELAEEGLAVREQPLDTNPRSPWPEDSVIRFYPRPPPT